MNVKNLASTNQILAGFLLSRIIWEIKANKCLSDYFVLAKMNKTHSSQLYKMVDNMTWSYLISIHHKVMRCDKGFEYYNPATIGSPFKECISKLWYINVHFICALDKICKRKVK